MAPAAPKPAPKPPPEAAAPAAGASHAPPAPGWVQIGLLHPPPRDKGWSDVAALARRRRQEGRRVEALSRDGKTLYRTYVTGFAGRDGAQAFCDRLKAAGKACFVK
jgi:hypothetical protein